MLREEERRAAETKARRLAAEFKFGPKALRPKNEVLAKAAAALEEAEVSLGLGLGALV